MLAQNFGSHLFMARIDVGVHEKNRDGLDIEFSYLTGKCFQRWDIQWINDFTFAPGSLGYFETQLPRNQWLVALIMKVKRIGPVAASDFQNIAKALTGDQGCLRALALNQRVDD